MLENRKILLAVSGGIAAYKAIELCSMLKKSGAEVKVLCTENASQFINPLSFEVISQNKVYSSMWGNDIAIPHIELADWANIIVIAPATANVIAKIAQGIGDDLLSSTMLAAHTPVVVVPAMNINMYNNPATQANIAILRERGYFFMEPEEGMLACGYKGKGRYPVNQEILYHIMIYLKHALAWKGKKVLITAGASREDIDPMRFITNHSTGKMGIALARAAHIMGAEVTLIAAHVTEYIPEYIKTIRAYTAYEMLAECKKEFPGTELLIMNAAVSDYTPAEYQSEKIKKKDDLSLELVRTQDVLANLSRIKQPSQLICGFAAESENIIENGKAKLQAKNLDYIVANDLGVAGSNITSCTFIKNEDEFALIGDKFPVAVQILDFISPDIIQDEK
ncbi:MAG: bifunctional phosphopantothenoylcysteine decarboxylase/phosphopantothenate--cysteine ligase CoaBC [Candidatus Stygibacter australis]|nr:bifunctional phosphopantothenoylcysteine decarboxylase/phosphopantothenate--cysteine ligase CoaBC [Candidatus Stygibacter australis]MDP8321163.1 bifunctional phosphopantothenoylcysteine decarboxylase/phosphopantothenate--cysteine ligase CoaBC [Candidatus Stygibacter australis]